MPDIAVYVNQISFLQDNFAVYNLIFVTFRHILSNLFSFIIILRHFLYFSFHLKLSSFLFSFCYSDLFLSFHNPSLYSQVGTRELFRKYPFFEKSMFGRILYFITNPKAMPFQFILISA